MNQEWSRKGGRLGKRVSARPIFKKKTTVPFGGEWGWWWEVCWGFGELGGGTWALTRSLLRSYCWTKGWHTQSVRTVTDVCIPRPTREQRSTWRVEKRPGPQEARQSTTRGWGYGLEKGGQETKGISRKRPQAAGRRGPWEGGRDRRSTPHPRAQAAASVLAVGDGAGSAEVSGQRGGEEEVVRAGLSAIHRALDEIGQRWRQAIQRERLWQMQASTGLQGTAQGCGNDEPFLVFMVWSRARGF